MFKYEHHNKIHRILNSLDTALFRDIGAHFGGGTWISLLHGEYRWSKDVDFLCPIGAGYKRLRQVTAASDPTVLFSETSSLTFPRPLTANQYGVRFLVMVDDTPIKFEIVAEARIAFAPPEYPAWLGVPCLAKVDRQAEKLLANADRWADSSIESRDLIDLAVLRLHEGKSDEAMCKAEAAYPVREPLRKALVKFQGSEGYRDKCFSALQIADRPMIIDGIDLLAADCGLEGTPRSHYECRREL